jgi:lysozyme family protein
MSEEETRVIAAQSGQQDGGAGDPQDDWLADDLDWSDPHDAAQGPRTGRRVAGAGSEDDARSPAIADVFRRRRAVALIAGVALVAALVLIPLVAFGGGSSPPATTSVTTTPPTTPATTTTPPPATTTTPAATITLPAGGSLKLGNTGPEVKSLQQALNTAGTATLKVDGTFGPATEQAVIAFQQANGLVADGVVGTKTVQALNAAVAQKP